MKYKFVKVFDNRRWGRIPYIILEIEKSDTSLIKCGFSEGYRFIIQALYHSVGASGGYHFDLKYDNVTDVSKKIDCVEANVLGNYLEDVKNIYDIPDNLYTEKIWNPIYYPEIFNNRNQWTDEYGSAYYYKAFIETESRSPREELDYLITLVTEFSEQSKDDSLQEYIEMPSIAQLNSYLCDERNRMINSKLDMDIPQKQHRILLIDKSTYKIEKYSYSVGHNDYESDYAKYLWLPYDVISEQAWNKVKQVNLDECELFEYSFYTPIELLDSANVS